VIVLVIVGMDMAGRGTGCCLRLCIALFEALCYLVHLVAELVERLCNLLLGCFELGDPVF